MSISAIERPKEDYWPVFIHSIANFIMVYILNYPILLELGRLNHMKPLFIP